jgi:hypothetical protein
MAPALPIGGSGDFGTSPFLGQLTDKTLLVPTRPLGVPDVKDNRVEKLFHDGGGGVRDAAPRRVTDFGRIGYGFWTRDTSRILEGGHLLGGSPTQASHRFTPTMQVAARRCCELKPTNTFCSSSTTCSRHCTSVIHSAATAVLLGPPAAAACLYAFARSPQATYGA